MTTQTQPSVEYRKLGDSGLRVSVPIVGGGLFGSTNWIPYALDEEKGMEILKAAWDRGVTTIDTANNYSNGASERIIGKFLKKYEYDIPRHRVLIFTKCYHLAEDDDVPFKAPEEIEETRKTRDYVNQAGLSRAAIFNQVEASLQRLQTPYVDMLQIHRFDPETPIEETMKALHDLVQSGKVRYLGASSMRAWQFAKMNEVARQNGWTPFVNMQNEYSLLYREEEREMIPYCKAHGIGLTPWWSLHSGDLAKPLGASSARKEGAKGTFFETQFTDADKAIINRVEEIAKKKGWTMSDVALSWIQIKVTSPIVGINSVERLGSSIVRDKELTEDEVKYLEEPYIPKPVRGHL